MNEPIHNSGSKTILIALVVVIVVIGAGFGYYYVQSSGTISSLNSTVTSQSSQIASQAAQIASDTTKIANLTSTVSNLRSTVSSLQAQVAADEVKITLLTAKDTAANQTIASLNSQVTTLTGQVNSDNSQISSLNSQIANYESQISTLQTQVDTLTAEANLSDSTLLVSSQQFQTGTSGQVQVISFTANYSGYVVIDATAASDYTHEGVAVQIMYASNIKGGYSGIFIPATGHFYEFSGIPDLPSFPVVPGTVTVYLATADTTPQTATISVTYYY